VTFVGERGLARLRVNTGGQCTSRSCCSKPRNPFGDFGYSWWPSCHKWDTQQRIAPSKTSERAGDIWCAVRLGLLTLVRARRDYGHVGRTHARARRNSGNRGRERERERVKSRTPCVRPGCANCEQPSSPRGSESERKRERERERERK